MHKIQEHTYELEWYICLCLVTHKPELLSNNAFVIYSDNTSNYSIYLIRLHEKQKHRFDP